MENICIICNGFIKENNKWICPKCQKCLSESGMTLVDKKTKKKFPHQQIWLSYENFNSKIYIITSDIKNRDKYYLWGRNRKDKEWVKIAQDNNPVNLEEKMS